MLCAGRKIWVYGHVLKAVKNIYLKLGTITEIQIGRGIQHQYNSTGGDMKYATKNPEWYCLLAMSIVVSGKNAFHVSAYVIYI